MIYTSLTYLAMRIAYDAHHGTLDKNGAPYIFHPFKVADCMDDEISAAVALLHDVVEDTDITFDDLRRKGIPESVIGPLTLMTHNDGSEYTEYIRKIGTDSIATKVKLSDLAHNMDSSRYTRPMTEYEKQREEKYRVASEYLKSRLSDFRCKTKE